MSWNCFEIEEREAPLCFHKDFSGWHTGRFEVFRWGGGGGWGERRHRYVFGRGWPLKCTVWCSWSWKRAHVSVWTCERVFVHQSFCFMYVFFFLLLFCLPCCKLVCVPKCAGATQLLCQPPCEVNIAALGKQIKEDLARAVKKGGEKGQTTSTQTVLYTALLTQFHETQSKAREGLSR